MVLSGDLYRAMRMVVIERVHDAEEMARMEELKTAGLQENWNMGFTDFVGSDDTLFFCCLESDI